MSFLESLLSCQDHDSVTETKDTFPYAKRAEVITILVWKQLFCLGFVCSWLNASGRNLLVGNW